MAPAAKTPVSVVNAPPVMDAMPKATLPGAKGLGDGSAAASAAGRAVTLALPAADQNVTWYTRSSLVTTSPVEKDTVTFR
jgi:hypothetical protein